MKGTLLFTFLLVCAAGDAQRIVTIAGLSVSHRAEVDGKSVLNPYLQHVYGLLQDRTTGRLILHDESNVERVEADGTLLVLAGSGVPTDGYIADGTPASVLRIGILRGIAQDASGALYLADALLSRVFRVGTDGTVSTFAGGGTFVNGSNGDGGPATAAYLNSPRGLVFDSKGNLFIADVFCGCIRKVTPDGIISTLYTLPGSRPAAAFTHFEGLAIDAQDNVYGTEYVGHQVMKVRPDGSATVIAGIGVGGFSGDGGPAAAAQLLGPSGVAVAADGTVYIADTRNHRVRKVTPDGVITTVAGTGAPGFSGDGGPADAAKLMLPAQLMLQPDGSMLIADYGNNRVRMVASNGIITTVAGAFDSAHPPPRVVDGGDGGPAIHATLSTVSSLAFDGSGNLLVADLFSSRVRKIGTDGMITAFAGIGNLGAYSGDGVPAAKAIIGAPFSVAVDIQGTVYIAGGDSRIRKVDSSGTISVVAGTGTGSGLIRSQGDGGPAVNATLNEPKGIAFDAAGNIYIADTSNARLRVIDRAGIIRTVAGPGQQGSEYWNGVAIDPLGNIYVSITHSEISRVWSVIDRVNRDGSLTTVAGNGQSCSDSMRNFNFDGQPAISVPLCTVLGFSFDSAGNLYIPEAALGYLLRVGPDGLVTHLAGNIHATELGDGGSPLSALLQGSGYYNPASVAIDAAGNLFLPSGSRVREITNKPLTLTLSRPRVDLQAGQSQSVSVTTNFAEPFPYLVRLQTTGAGGWLSVNRFSGQTGESFALTANPAGLAAGVYRGTVTVMLLVPDPVQVELPVSLTVQ